MGSKEEEAIDHWNEKYNKTLWFKVLFDEEMLGLKTDFLKYKREGGKSYRENINEGLLCAADAMKKTIPGEMVAISQLLHTASSVILLESERKRVDTTLNFLRSKGPFNEIDPTVVMTSVALYYLILNAEHNYANQKENLEAIKHLHTRLDQMNWFVGTDGMKDLGITRLEP